jgi:hypothetical protein
VADETRFMVYGEHVFDMASFSLSYRNNRKTITALFFSLETINDSSPMKIEITMPDGTRLTDSEECRHIDELELP